MGKYQQIYQKWEENPNQFWLEQAEKIHWYQKPTIAYKQKQQTATWFNDGICNTCYNCLDIHLKQNRKDQKAIIYDSPLTQKIQSITFQQLYNQVTRIAAVIKHFGVEKGDRVIIYMPMIPQTIVAMLACARIGAVHSVVFGGFAPRELATRIDDAKPKIIISASAGIEPKAIIRYKPMLDKAINMAKHKPELCIIYQREEAKAELQENRDYDWQQLYQHAEQNDWSVECQKMNSNDPLYILYTSGTTGEPKGIVRDNGGHMVALKWSMENIYDVKPGEVFWSASDVGWVVGHSYIVYAPLLNGSTTLLYEGKPIGTPDAGEFWRVIQQHKVVSLFTAPTAFRAIKREDNEGKFIKKYHMNSLRTLFLAGERAEPEVIKWAKDKLKIPVVDHWWQTETGWAITANPLGIENLPVKHGSSGVPMPGYKIDILDENACKKKNNEIGNICIKLPLPPSCLATIWQKHQQYIDKYEKPFLGYYFTADAGYRDENGFIYVMARTDDIINIAGHRISTGAIEEIVVEHQHVAEAAVVGVKDKIKGQVPVGFVVLNLNVKTSEEDIEKHIVEKVRNELGAIAVFKNIVFVERLPKTRSGKVLRASLRKIIDGENAKIPPTIDDENIIYEIIVKIKQKGFQSLGEIIN